jgi:hypothetical protein
MLSRITILAVVLALAGCDGYAHSFRVSAAMTGKAPSERRLLSVATKVAHERGYTVRPATQQQYTRFTVFALFQKHTGQQESVTIELVRDFKDGAERFIILDWPSFTRSDESKAVEAEIRAQFTTTQASNHSDGVNGRPLYAPLLR